MCIQNAHSDTVSGNDLYDFKVRKYYESIMEPIVMEKLILHLDLEPHVDRNDLKVCFYNYPHRVKLWVPVHLTFSINQMLERIYEQYEKDLPALIDSDCLLNELDKIHNELNKK